jgi:hypothetical protein
MSAGNYAASIPGKTSSDSGPSVALDRWSQRRLQRLNTEQGFREQRQGGNQGTSPTPPLPSAPLPSGEQQHPSQQQQPTSSHSSRSYSTSAASYAGAADVQALPQLPTQPPQQQQQQPSAYQSSRTGSQPNVGLNIQTQSNPSTRPPQYQQESQTSQPPYSPTDHYAAKDNRPALSSSRSFTQASITAEDSASMSNNGPVPAQKAARQAGNGNNRQSVHNGMMSRDGSHAQQGGQAAGYGAGQAQNYKADQGQTQQREVGRGTPQPAQTGEDMNEDEVTQLIKDHKELREFTRCGVIWLGIS